LVASCSDFSAQLQQQHALIVVEGANAVTAAAITQLAGSSTCHIILSTSLLHLLTVLTTTCFCCLQLRLVPWLWYSLPSWLPQPLAMMVEESEIMHTIAFMLASSLINVVLSIPWSLYSTFVVEERHGFNKQTLGGCGNHNVTLWKWQLQTHRFVVYL
jgi:hypothetical protein